MPSSTSNRKAKAAKKALDPVNTSKQIEDTIAMLEKSKAGDKEQEMEIEREVKKATRELNNLLSNMDPSLSRVDTLQRKYSELFAEMKRVEREHIKSKKRADQLQKERDASRTDLTKMTGQKDRMEKLAREMQRENKRLKDENRSLRDTETRMREDLHNRLESMATDVQEVVDQKEHPERIPFNMETDDLFRQKFKSFVDHYELRELHFHSILRTKELEVQYQLARYEQQRRAQEQEANKSRQLTSQVSTFSQTETELRNQLNIYVEKFKQVEDTLNNSNDLFMTFRKEMEEMSKKTKRLEKENYTLTRRHDATKENVIAMAEDRARANEEIKLLRREKEKLERLCRGMQAQGRGLAPTPTATPTTPLAPVASQLHHHYHQQQTPMGQQHHPQNLPLVTGSRQSATRGDGKQLASGHAPHQQQRQQHVAPGGWDPQAAETGGATESEYDYEDEMLSGEENEDDEDEDEEDYSDEEDDEDQSLRSTANGTKNNLQDPRQSVASQQSPAPGPPLPPPPPPSNYSTPKASVKALPARSKVQQQVEHLNGRAAAKQALPNGVKH